MKEYDRELLRSLVEQGKTNQEIADQMDLSIGQVQYRIMQEGMLGARPIGGYHKPTQKKPKKEQPKPKGKGSNWDRRKCRTCKWRGSWPISCNYSGSHIRPRSAFCTVEDCTLYEKGRKQKGKPAY